MIIKRLNKTINIVFVRVRYVKQSKNNSSVGPIMYPELTLTSKSWHLLHLKKRAVASDLLVLVMLFETTSDQFCLF